MVGAARTLFVLATAAGVSLMAACTSGSTADCSPGEGGNPNQPAWCGVPAGDSGEVPETSPMDTGSGDSASEAGPDAAPETGAAPESGTGSPEAATDAPPG